MAAWACRGFELSNRQKQAIDLCRTCHLDSFKTMSVSARPAQNPALPSKLSLFVRATRRGLRRPFMPHARHRPEPVQILFRS
jgi:hypothetical protein